MSDLLVSATAAALEAAEAQLRRPAAWPDPASGFAYRLLTTTQLPIPSAFHQPLRPTNAQLLRRTPELAAFGYVITQATADSQVDWAHAFERLMGREIFPSDRNSFVYSPLEPLGISLGVAECPAATDAQRGWRASTIRRGFIQRQFLELTRQVAAACAERTVTHAQASSVTSASGSSDLSSLQSGEVALLAGFALLFPHCDYVDVLAAEREIVSRILATPVRAGDTAEAAAMYVALRRAVDRATLALAAGPETVEFVIGLCRRFPLFVNRLNTRQRDRTPYLVKDEYDVQDLLHAILKLHLDDVRPEEWTPSYAGNASRIDFLLPRERMIIEAKMTRSGLGQKEVANELIVDVARYSTMPQVDNLVCLIYDPENRCVNPAALENDLAQTLGRLRVKAIVCPRGT